LPRPLLPGAYQLDNMATALAAVLTLLPKAAENPAALAQGLRSVRLEGRLQRVSQQPAVWIDVGHNPLGARAVAAALAEIKAAEGMPRCRCVLGMLADKDAAAVAAELQTVVSDWYCAGLGGSRGQTAQQLAERIGGAVGTAPLEVYDSVEAALDAALAASAANDGVLVFGSFLTASAAGKHWRRLQQP
jgi:dihydrofolate synthase/folylpolyglutamate synthase